MDGFRVSQTGCMPNGFLPQTHTTGVAPNSADGVKLLKNRNHVVTKKAVPKRVNDQPPKPYRNNERRPNSSAFPVYESIAGYWTVSGTVMFLLIDVPLDVVTVTVRL